MDQMQTNESKRLVTTIIAAALAFVAVFAAAWYAMSRFDSNSETGNEEYVSTPERTKEEIVADIENRQTVSLDEDEAARKREILEAIER